VFQVRGWEIRGGEGFEVVVWSGGGAVVDARRMVWWWEGLRGRKVVGLRGADWGVEEWKRRWMGVEFWAALHGLKSAGWSLRHRNADRSCAGWEGSILECLEACASGEILGSYS